MKQLALELGGYPRPIAWTLSEVERAVGHRDRHLMLLTALEEITRYLVLVQLARYVEYWGQHRRDAQVERRVADLRRPSFGHYVTALGALDNYLAAADDPYTIHVAEQRRSPAMLHLFNEAGASAKRVSILGFLGKIVELRNKKKGHGYSAQLDAQTLAEYLQPALTELLNHMPLLVARPLLWVERIEYLDAKRWVVTMLELMGTQRARRFPREVQDPGGLKKGFLYMWDGESSPLQLTPFLHLDQGSEEERVYVLAGLAGDPVYQARGQSDARRHPDQLLTQLAERAPFLLESTPAVTTARPPDAAKWYRAAVEVALADGMVSAAEEARLTALRLEIGMPEGEALVIHSELGWHAQEVSPAPSAPRDTPSRKPTQDAWQAAAHRLLSRVRDRLPGQLSFDPKAVLLDDEIDSGDGELWIELGRSQGVSVWFPSKRGAHLRLAVGFYSTHGSRDPAYRAARGQLESGSLPSRSGWSPWSLQSKASDLALESHTRVSIAGLDAEALTEKLLGAVVALANAAAAALAGPVDAPAPSPPEVRGDAEPVSSPVPADFPLDPLVGSPRIRGSLWITRILWALEWARRHDPAPKSAASIAKILSAHGVSVPGTNTARAFRDAKDDPRVGGLVEQVEGQCYVITARGRRALFERSD